MKQRIFFALEDFPTLTTGVSELAFTEKSLLRAVVAAGQKPNSTNSTRASRADAEMRRSAMISALDMSGSNLTPTPEFCLAGSTDQATKSFYVGTALCAHAAYVELHIPWLVDIENKKLKKRYEMEWRPTGKRPDFVGLDSSAQWYVFESKGRVTKPSYRHKSEWKIQAQSIARVNGQTVSQHIISAAHLDKAKSEWQLLWVDPPVKNEPVELAFDDFSFFDSYYDPIRELIDSGFLPISVSEGLLFYIPTLGVYVGLHQVVLGALERQDPSSIREFAGVQSGFDLEEIENRPVSVYADGVMIAFLHDLNDDQIHSLKALLHTRQPGVRCQKVE